MDLTSGIIHLEDTKNGHSHIVVLSDFVVRLLAARKHTATSAWVFPAERGGDKPFRQETAYKKIIALSGVKSMPHDCRRTFLTIGDELEIKNEVLQALVNHRNKSINERYIIRSTERLRKATQRITDRILAYAGINRKPEAQLVSLKPATPAATFDLEGAIINAVGKHEGQAVLIEVLHRSIEPVCRPTYPRFVRLINRLAAEGWLAVLPCGRGGQPRVTCGDRLRIRHGTGTKAR